MASLPQVNKRSAGLLLVTERRILLLRRARSVPNGRRWGMPGGQRGTDEHPYETACREAVEELQQLPRFEVRDVLAIERKSKRCDVYVCRVSEVDRLLWAPQLSPEHEAHRWVAPKWCVRHLDRLHPDLRLVFASELGLERVLHAMQGVVSDARIGRLLERAHASGAPLPACLGLAA